MNKHGRIIEIRGFKGILTAIFIVCCLVTGFTVFPGFIAMNIWNMITPYITDMPQMSLIHGVMLWAIVFLIWFAFNGRFPSFHFGCHSAMNEEEIKEFVEKIQKEREELNKENNHTEE
ncbi:hypothetical protein IJG14_05245 [bacterium]|nr:hypothetical protein [bacterium]